MATETLSSAFLLKRGIADRVSAYAGPEGEVVVDLTKQTLVVQTGSAGGVALAKASTPIIAGHGIAITGGTLASSNTIGLAPVSNVAAGDYGPADSQTIGSSGTFNVPSLTVDNYGRVTSIENQAITFSLETPSTSTLSPATTSTLGGVIVSSGLSVDNTGAIAVTSAPVAENLNNLNVGNTQQPVYFSAGIPVAGNAPLYSVPQATTSSLGGVKVGSGLSIDSAGVLTGTTVSVVPNVTSGAKIATVTVDGTSNDLYAPSGGSTVSVTPVVSSGTKIATVTVDGTSKDLYAPNVSVSPALATGTKIATVTVDSTPTDLYAPNVSVSPALATGTKIATVTIGSTLTDLYAPSGGVSTVSVTPVLSTGTKIATITVDSTSTDLYAPSGGSSTIVVGTPTITGNDYGVAGHAYEFAFSAYSSLQNVSIAQFVVDGGALGTANVSAISNGGQYSFDIPSNAATGSEYTITVYAVDSFGNQSVSAPKTIEIHEVFVETPVIERTAYNSKGSYSFYAVKGYYSGSSNPVASENFQLKLSSLPQVVGGTDSLEYYEFKICSDVIGNNILLTKTINSISVDTDIAVASANEIEADVDNIWVFCRVKYATYDYSNWSNSLQFKFIIAEEKPYLGVFVNTNPQNLINIALPLRTIEQDVTYVSSSFSLFNIIYTTIAYTKYDFIICSANTPDVNIVYELRNDSKALSSGFIITGNTVLQSVPTDQTLYCFARVSTDGTTWSAWSDPALLHVVSSIVKGYAVVNTNDNNYISKTNGRVFSIAKQDDLGTPASYTISAIQAVLKSGNTTLQTYDLSVPSSTLTISSSDLNSVALGDEVSLDIMTTYTQNDTTKTVTSSSVYTVTNNIITPSGRTLYRHSSNQGSVLEFDMFGTPVKLFVADAQYRKRDDTKWGASEVVTPLKKFSTADSSELYVGKPYESNSYFYSDVTQDGVANAVYVEGSTRQTSVYDYAVIAPITDAQLQSRFFRLAQDQTARENCDVWMTYQGQTDSSSIIGVPAVEYARSLSITGISNGLDIPNLYELCVLFVEGDYIDTLDPTVGDNPAKALGKFLSAHRWFHGRWCWSSTEYSPANQWYVGGTGNMDSYPKSAGSGSGSVAPTRELA